MGSDHKQEPARQAAGDKWLGKRYLNIREAAEFTGYAVGTLYGWVSQRRVPVIKKRGRLRFDVRALELWMQADARGVVSDEERS